MRTSSEESDIEYELCRSVSNKQPTPHSIADILGLGFRISCETRDDSLLRPLLRQVRRVQKSEMADCVTERDMDMMANDEPLDLSVHKSRCRGSEDEHVSDSPKAKRRTIVDSHASYQAPQLNGQSDQSLQMAANFSTVLQYYLTAARLWQSEVIQCNESRSASSVEMTASDENALMAEATRPESSGPPAATKSSKRRKKELDSAVTDGASRPRKTRTTFTGKQLFELEKIFEQKKYLSSNERQEVARLLNVTGSQVISNIWLRPFSVFLSSLIPLSLFNNKKNKFRSI